MWPQYTWIVIFIIWLIAEACMHGKPRSGNHNFPVAIVFRLFGVVILYYGGFFDPLIESGFFSR